MAQLPFKVTELFEEQICRYTGAKYCVAVDNLSNAIFMCLELEKMLLHINPYEHSIKIPKHTYPSIPCEILHAGFKVEFEDSEPYMNDAYYLKPSRIVDSAVRFTANMYIPNTLTCLSFSGAFKHLKLGKGGAILTDDLVAYAWLKRFRNSGRGEVSYHDDNFTVLGKNNYLLPEISARGLVFMNQFYDENGKPKDNPNLRIKYPDLSKFEVYNQVPDNVRLYEENKLLLSELKKLKNGN